MPPMFPMPEALSALDLIDGAFIVARAGKSTAPEVDAAERAIAEHSKSFGVLLNDCQFPDPLVTAHPTHD